MEVPSNDQNLKSLEVTLFVDNVLLEKNGRLTQNNEDSCVSISLELSRTKPDLTKHVISPRHSSGENKWNYCLEVAVSSKTPIRFLHDVTIVSYPNIISVIRSPVFVSYPVQELPPESGPFVDRAQVEASSLGIGSTSWSSAVFAVVKYYKPKTSRAIIAYDVLEHLQTARSEKTLTDCSVQVGDRKLDAHRCILSAHSGVFRAMFDHEDTAERASGIIDIKDFSFEAVEAMLDFIYAGSTEKLQTCVVEVYKLADKYGIAHLRYRCYEALMKEVPENEFCSLLELGHFMSSDELLNICEDFIKGHQSFLKTEQWIEFRKKNPEAAFLMYDKLL